MKILIIGCGWLGLPLGKVLSKEGNLVFGTTTTPEKLSILTENGIIGMVWHSEDTLKLEEKFDFIIVAIPPNKVQNYETKMLEMAKQIGKNSPVIFISSTSVYKDCAREVKETDFDLIIADSPIKKAEDFFLHHCQTLILRFSGLMGGERFLLKYFSGKKTSGWNLPVNHVFIHDAIRAIQFFISNKFSKNEIFNVSAPLHPTKREVLEAQASKMQLPPVIFEAHNELATYKIISGQKLEHFGFDFLHKNPCDF